MNNKIIYTGLAITVVTVFIDISLGIYFGVLTNLLTNILREPCKSNKVIKASKVSLNRRDPRNFL